MLSPSRILLVIFATASVGCDGDSRTAPDAESVTVASDFETRDVGERSARDLAPPPPEEATEEGLSVSEQPPEREVVAEPWGPTRYGPGQVHSPLTPGVVENLQTIASLDLSRRDDVFAKIGASSFDSVRTLACFAGDHVDRDLMSAEAVDTLDLFLEGDADGDDPFSRDAVSAVSGKTAAWVIAGDPSPLITELDATQARFGLIEYGTNDMGMGSTYASAMPGFADALVTLTDTLIVQGVIPVLHTNRARLDSSSANRWVGTYNAVIRGVAQGRQVPLLDQFALLEDLPDHGLGGDGLHMSAYVEDGSVRTCRFHGEAMTHGYNVRNLATLEALARLTAVVTDGLEAPDAATDAMWGEGTMGAPFVIDSLPFTAMRSTSDSAQAILDVYTGCGADQDESGPEHLYQLTLTEATRLRALVLDQGEVDVDIHLLDETATVAGCLARHDRLWEGTLGPGTYHFSLDTFVSGGEPRPGEYLFVLVTCHPEDDACDSWGG